MKIPAWAMKEEKYEPTRDRDYFISRSLLRVMRVLFSFQQQARRPDGNRISAVAALCFLIGWLVLGEKVGPARAALMGLIAAGAVIVEFAR